MEKKIIEDFANKNGLTVEQLNQIAFINKIDFSSEFLENTFQDIINKQFQTVTINKHVNQSALKSFEIIGLFRTGNDYKFDFEDDINIFVSENGVGKTSILKLLIAVLENDYETLNEIYFEIINIKINDNTYTINKTKICQELQKDYYVLLDCIRSFLNPSHYISLINDFNETRRFNLFQIESYLRKNVRSRNRTENPFIYRKGYQLLQKIRERESELLKEQLGTIKEDLKSEILFYPTYRKIEASQEKIFFTDDDDIEITNKYISFGMNDVEQQINSLLFQLRSSTNRAYTEINSKIINDLATEELSKLINDVKKIDIHKFDVVIDRIGKDNITCYENLKKYIQGKISNLPNGDFLTYYINKLISIYDNQKPLSDRLLKFTEVCNKYLVNKQIKYDESLLQVDIVSVDDDTTPIGIDDLSSGEKQIVSIFSKVYLGLSTPSILIIDEPEISLSIEWQKQFLKDIYDSHKINLLIATTHSPFIFKNEFREFTKDMDVFRK